jgi:hypothetical protein
VYLDHLKFVQQLLSRLSYHASYSACDTPIMHPIQHECSIDDSHAVQIQGVPNS